MGHGASDMERRGLIKLGGLQAATIRAVEHNDFEALARFLENNNRPEITRHFNPFPLDSKTAYRIACTEHRDQYYVAVLKDEIVGFCMLRGWDEGFQIPSFGILVGHRHISLGLGRKMTEFAISEARASGCAHIRLTVYASNTIAFKLYTRLGFREIARQVIDTAEEADIKIVMMKDLTS
jgi:ribosomal protein S18 acetylase RimI-like enzyme